MNLNIVLGLAYIFFAWKWGDWKNWRFYYPTILFFITGDLLYQFLFHDYSMWEFVPVGKDKELNLTHTHITLMILSIKYPATILIFLGNFPSSRVKQIGFIGIWVLIYTANEWFTMSNGGIIHQHGWNMKWSILFNIVMFTILAVHRKRPLIAWSFSIAFIIFLFQAHDVPMDILK
ncbi:hypothetical protein GCM10008967_20130 [Bacillus carboniphilus]|uniref:Uncharacterized protein n=1 Tax=Bacillus carboniphilus TaxID=86663 RepID=A0ABP3G0F1_9BACI